MNQPPFSKAHQLDSIDEAIRRGAVIYFDEKIRKFVTGGSALSKPSHLKTRVDAETFAALNEFVIQTT